MAVPARPAPWLFGVLSTGVLLALAGAVLRGAAPLPAAALIVGCGALPPAAALIRRAWGFRVASRSLPAWQSACRCPGLLGVGVLVGGATVAGLPAVTPAYRSLAGLTGLATAAGVGVVGLLHAPGAAPTRAARLRHTLDGLIVGSSVALVGWLLLPDIGVDRPFAYLAATIAAGTAAVALAATLGAPGQRAAVLRCGGGVVLAVTGLALLVVVPLDGTAVWPVLVGAALALAGPPLVWAGARTVAPSPWPARPAAGYPQGQVFAGYPVLAAPLTATVLAVGYHLLTADELDRAGVLLGTVVAALLAVREFPTAADLRRYARRLAAQEAHLRALLAGAGDVTMVLADDLVVRWQSPAGYRLLGLRDQQVVGQRFTDLVHPDDAAAVADALRGVVDTGTAGAERPLLTARLRDGLGCWRDTESTVSDLRGAPVVGALVVQVRDVGQRRALERTLHRLTCCDQLTGLSNRRELLRAITTRRGAGRRAGTLLVIDLTGFCAVIDSQGRAAGDTLLLSAAQRLRTLVGPDDLVSRLGERQFAVVTAAGPIEAYAAGCRMLSELGKSYQLPSGRPVRLVVSVGLTSLDDAVPAEEVVRRGDLAVGRAAEASAARIDWYDASLEEHLVRRVDVEHHLPGAAGRGELDLLYQPVVELASGRPVGVEALLRWRHPVLGTVLPAELLPAAERLRLGAEIGEWALHTACRQVAAWRRRGYDLWLAVNVSARQLASTDFVPEVAAALSVHQNPPERLTVEVSEVELADQLGAVAGQLSKLRALGVRTGLDDVGTRHTDLGQLRRLPLDVMKLSPPRAAERGGESPAEVAAAVVDVARRIGATVVAEGLETEEQCRLVRHAGCEYGQGYLMAAPSPAEHLEAFLERRRPPAR